MRSAAELRRANLETLVLEKGTLAAVAKAAGTSSVYLSQIRNGTIDVKTGQPRSMGAEMARRLEKGCDKPDGWMDHEHEPVDAAVPGAGKKLSLSGRGGAVTRFPGMDRDEFRRTYNQLAEMVASIPDERRAEVANLLGMWIKTGKESFLDVLFVYFDEFKQAEQKKPGE